MSILFINGSPNKDGNTVKLTRELLKDEDFETINLVDYKIYSYGQKYADDDFLKIVARIESADTVVIGSPMHWYSTSGAVRNLLDRSDELPEKVFAGKKLFFVFQGESPTQEQLASEDYTMSRYALMYGFEYMGMVNTLEEAKEKNKFL